MQLKDLIGLLIAFLLAMAVAFGTRHFLMKAQDGASKPIAENVLSKVIVAGRYLKQGEKIKAGDLVWQAWPEKNINTAYISEGEAKPQDFTGFLTRDNFVEGEPIIASNIVRAGDRGALTTILDPGKRAMSIEITLSSGSSGLITPGDIVDVIASNLSVPTGSSPPQEREPYVQKGQTLLKNIRVVAVDTLLAPPSPTDKPATGSTHTVTLEVTEAQAEILAGGVKSGGLILSIHSLGLPDENEKSEEALQVKKEGEAPKVQDLKVTIFRGQTKSETNFEVAR